MDAIAERGVAAHWKYKEKPNSVPEIEQKEIEDKLSWFRDFSMMTDEESRRSARIHECITKGYL